MCNAGCIDFVASHLADEWITDKKFLEVGSRDVNGSVRPNIEAHAPASYIGVDIEAGPRVDEILDVCNLVARFGPDSFDVVISTEMVEHVRDWRTAFGNMKTVLKPGGLLFITTRSKGFPLHGWPEDFWRFELGDMRQIFDDMEMLALESDKEDPGVFVVARSTGRPQRDLAGIGLYSMLAKRRLTTAQARVFFGLIYPLQKLWGRVIGSARALVKRDQAAGA